MELSFAQDHLKSDALQHHCSNNNPIHISSRQKEHLTD